MDGSYVYYAEALSDVRKLKDQTVLPADLVREVADRYYEICRRSLEDMSDSSGDDYLAPVEQETLCLERDTWTLIRYLYQVRVDEPIDGPTPLETLQRNPYTPPEALISRMLAASPRLNELYIVANWLRDIAPPVQLPDHPPGYRINTKMKLRHGRVGQPGHENLVRAIDPDVLNRESGLSLDPQDAAYEKSLSYTLFACVRAGRLDQAMDICANHEHAWLAAVMRGSLPFRWPAITSRDLTGQVDSDSIQSDPAEVWTGNWRRKLWRQTCLRACSSPTLPVSTRALYASLCLSSQSMTALTPLLKTWEDHLWARSEMLFQDRIANQLEAMGGFWEHGMKIGGHIAPHAVYAVSEDHWSGEVEKVLAEMETIKVEQGLDYRDAIHFAQLNIIMGRTNQLLESFADHLAREDTPQTESRQWAIVVRFYTHLCLFLRLIGYEVSLHATDVILSAYVGILESQGHGQLVALYVGALSENAVDKYASYLSRLDVHLSRSEREAALRRCQDHGLNVGEVAVRTAATIARNVLSRLPRADGPLPDPVTGSVNLTPDEYQLCRSVEWLVYDKSTHDEALNQANRMIRYFLGIGRLTTARFMHESLPLDLVRTSPNHDFEIPAAIEFVYYRRFFTLMNEFDKLPRVEEFPENESVPKKAAWKEAFVRQVDATFALGVELLESSWLVNDKFELFDDRRTAELDRVRKIYLPEVVIRLNHMLYASRELVPRNLQRTMEIVPIVADERNHVYSAFMSDEGNRLKDYLDGVRKVGLAVLEQGNVVDLFGKGRQK